MKKEKKLSNKRKAFCHEYIKKWNIYKSCIKAGYSHSYAKSLGYKLLDNIGIQRYIKQILSEIEKEVGISKVTQLLKLKKIAYKKANDLLKYKDIMEAMKEINKMLGYYSPEKFDHTTDGEKINQPTQVIFKNARKKK